MRHLARFRSGALLIAAILALAACKSTEERAEERFQSGVVLAEQGDFDRAVVELRSVFELDPSHLEARRTLATILLEEKNNLQGAYAQFLRLAEQFPDDVDTRVMLSELAFVIGNWDEFDRHSAPAIELGSDLPEVAAITIAASYRAAVIDEDPASRRDAARAAEALVSDLSQNAVLQRLIIDNHVREGAMDEALAATDTLLEGEPDNTQIWRQRQTILVQMQDFEALEDQLRTLVDKFPEDNERKSTLIRFLLELGKIDEAEAFLRELAEQSGDLQIRVDLIRFVSEVRGTEAARTEIAVAKAAYPEAFIFDVLEAGLDFSEGEQEKAVAAIEATLEGRELSEEVNRIKVTLARMLLGMGNEVGARVQVEEVLANDASNAEALKMQAAWQIEADDTDAAIAGLRLALDQNEDDVQAMELMAQAYIRAGQPNLARDFLALAVDASGQAPTQVLRYAGVLIDDESFRPAEDILIAALRQDPDNLEILGLLGQVYLGTEDYSRGDQVVQTLRNLEDDQARDMATRLEAELINRRIGTDQAIGYLEEVAQGADASLGTKVALLRARLVSGETEAALGLAREMQAGDPDNPALKAMLATTETVNGNLAEAEALYEDLLQSNPNQPQIWLETARLKVLQGSPDAARAVIDEALAVMPESGDLLWAKASYLERDGNIDGAIEIYEGLYEQNSGSLVVANNLASLLSTHRLDDESLERAWTIARRFRDVENPAIQDTYGWILQRRGESEDALPYLEAAARDLPQDPIVQFHLGETYAALGRSEDAVAQYRRAVELAAETDQRRQIVRAREQIEALSVSAQPSE